MPPASALKKRFECLYRHHDFSGRAAHDPIQVPRSFRSPEDMEAAGFLAAAFAFGSVRQFIPLIDRIVSPMGKSPHDFLLNFSVKRHARLFADIRYRFYTERDVLAIIYATGRVLKKYGSIKAAFLTHYRKDDAHIGRGLAGLVGEIRKVNTRQVFGERGHTQGYRFCFPSPETGSACKRANLFLRWMVRRADIDLGIWPEVQPSQLVVPLDLHIARISRCLGLTSRKSNDWKTAVDITRALQKFDPEDPLKYDFALSHLGISGLCSKRVCGECELKHAA